MSRLRTIACIASSLLRHALIPWACSCVGIVLVLVVVFTVGYPSYRGVLLAFVCFWLAFWFFFLVAATMRDSLVESIDDPSTRIDDRRNPT